MRCLLDKPWLSFAYITVLVLLMNLKGVDSFVESMSWVGAGGTVYFILACFAWRFKNKAYTKYPFK